MASAVSPGPLPLSIEDFPDPTLLLDAPEGRIRAHNAAFAEWAGRADATGLGLADLLPGDAGAARLWDEARATGAAEHYVERRGRDGESSLWSLRARRTPAGVVVCAADLSAIAAAAHAVHAAERDYVAVAAHELRAPLAAIKAWASALDPRATTGAAGLGPRRADPHADTMEGLVAIARQVDRMNELLTDLFDAARSGAGALCAERAPVGVDALVRRALAGTPYAARATLGPVPADEVHVDAAQIEGVICRLLGWIAARSPAGPLAIRVEREGAEVHVLFADPGPELSPRAEGELWIRAVRSRSGRGLGLYLCQQLAAASGARVFRERAGGGARFVLALPAAPLHARSLPAETEPDAGQRCARPGPRPARVLVGEPDPARRARALAALRLEGYEADGAPDGPRLLEALEAGRWEVVVADVLALGPGGVETLRRLLARPAPPAVVVISPTAERPEALVGAERAGALAVLARPLDWPHLVSLIGCAAARG